MHFLLKLVKNNLSWYVRKYWCIPWACIKLSLACKIDHFKSSQIKPDLCLCACVCFYLSYPMDCSGQTWLVTTDKQILWKVLESDSGPLSYSVLQKASGVGSPAVCLRIYGILQAFSSLSSCWKWDLMEKKQKCKRLHVSKERPDGLRWQDDKVMPVCYIKTLMLVLNRTCSAVCNEGSQCTWQLSCSVQTNLLFTECRRTRRPRDARFVL